jgi:hypothetical protein
MAYRPATNGIVACILAWINRSLGLVSVWCRLVFGAGLAALRNAPCPAHALPENFAVNAPV